MKRRSAPPCGPYISGKTLRFLRLCRLKNNTRLMLNSAEIFFSITSFVFDALNFACA